MNKLKRNLGIGTLFVLGAMGFTSCEDNIESIQFDAIGDVFVQKIKVGEEVKYGINYYAYSNMRIKSASVTTPGDDGVTIELDQDGVDTRRFRMVTEVADFTSEMPMKGDYQFTVVSNDQDTLYREDELFDTEIDAIELSEYTYDQENHSFSLAWNEIEDADLYAVKVMDEHNGNLLFLSPRLTKPEFEFNATTSGWLNGLEMKESTTYVLSVSAYKYENSDLPSGYDIQMESLEYREFTW